MATVIPSLVQHWIVDCFDPLYKNDSFTDWQ
jgi:hypothetical protein